jgi:hypothetical protein
MDIHTLGTSWKSIFFTIMDITYLLAIVDIMDMTIMRTIFDIMSSTPDMLTSMDIMDVTDILDTQ